MNFHDNLLKYGAKNQSVCEIQWAKNVKKDLLFNLEMDFRGKQGNFSSYPGNTALFNVGNQSNKLSCGK